MKTKKVLVFFLVLFIAFSPLYAYAKALNINRILTNLTNPKLTSLQKSDAIRQYKGQVVRGRGKVKDVLQGAGSKNEVIVYVEKSFKGKNYELVLMVDRESAEKLKKGKTVRFEGTFEGMSFNALRFKNVEIRRGKVCGLSLF